MTERDARTQHLPGPDDEARVGWLMERAGPRPEVPEEDLAGITGAARTAWRETVERRRRRRRRTVVWGAALAAATVLIAVGLAWWVAQSPDDGARPAVARLERVQGRVLVDGGPTERDSAGRNGEAAEGRVLVVGMEVATGAGEGGERGRAVLTLRGGTRLRLDSGTRLRLISETVLDLDRGAVYAETGPGGTLAVVTPLGTARDVGTRFAVRLAGDAILRVRVREGAVVVERRGRSHHAVAGQELVVHRGGAVDRSGILPYGPEWGWVIETTPPFELEGKTVRELLDWVERETGWEVRYAEPEIGVAADEIVLHGSLGELRPDQAPFTILPGAGLDAELSDGTLIVRR